MICRLFLGLFILNGVFQTVLACDVIDDTGQHLRIKNPSQRIVSLAPDLTEILFAVGAGKKIIGVMKGSDYPSQAKKIPIVASYNVVNVEAILALHPDLIVSWTDVSFTQQLKILHVPIYFSHQKKLSDISNTMNRLACLTGNEQSAKQVVHQFMNDIAATQSQYSNKQPVTVFYQVWPKPLMTITKESWINEIISLCGGRNIFADLIGVAPQVGVESVLVANPQVILGEGLGNWQKWDQISAVREHRVFIVNPDWVDRAGPRIAIGVKNVCKMINKARV